jgi:hypothetical protein
MVVDINDYPIDQLNIAIFKKLVIEFKARTNNWSNEFLLLRFFNKKLPASINQVQHKRFNIIVLSFIESKMLQATQTRNSNTFIIITI